VQASCPDGQGVTVAHEGRCCPDLCPAVYTPVCGNDGQTYSNNCTLQAVLFNNNNNNNNNISCISSQAACKSNVTFAYAGECRG
jgi:hypothetical protein